jgi:hypothetical protein
VLCCVFSTKDIEFLHAWRPLQGPPLELQRVAFLIYETQRITRRATVARVTTRLRHWCQLFHADEDAASIVSIAAYGAHAAFVAPPPWIDAVPNSILPHDTYATVTDISAWLRTHSISVKFLLQRYLCVEHSVPSTRRGRCSTPPSSCRNACFA